MKKVICIVIILCIGILITGCRCSSSYDESNDTKQERSKVTVRNNTENSTTNSTANISKTDSELNKIELNNTILLKDGKIEFTMNGIGFQDEVNSTSDNMYAHYFVDEEGESYFVAQISIRNIGGNTVNYNDFKDIKVVFNDTYNYTMQQVDPASSVLSQFWQCEPLKTTDIYWVQSVPDEVKEMKPYITFKVGNKTYKYE